MTYRITSFPRSPSDLLATALVTGVFHDCCSASRAVEEAVTRGYGTADISIVVSDEVRRLAIRVAAQSAARKDSDSKGPGVPRAVASASVVRSLAGASPVLLPGIRIFVSGPFAGRLAGAVHAVADLRSIGFPDHHAARFEQHLRLGRVLAVLQARSTFDADTIEAAWKEWAFEVLDDRPFDLGT